MKVDLLSQGDYSLLWIEETLLIRAKGPVVRPYAGVGVGYYVTDHDLSANVETLLGLLGLRAIEDIEDGLGLHLRGGIIIVVGPRISLNGDVKFLFFRPKVEVTVTDLVTFQSVILVDDVDLNTLSFRIGVTVNL